MRRPERIPEEGGPTLNLSSLISWGLGLNKGGGKIESKQTLTSLGSLPDGRQAQAQTHIPAVPPPPTALSRDMTCPSMMGCEPSYVTKGSPTLLVWGIRHSDGNSGTIHGPWPLRDGVHTDGRMPLPALMYTWCSCCCCFFLIREYCRFRALMSVVIRSIIMLLNAAWYSLRQELIAPGLSSAMLLHLKVCSSATSAPGAGRKSTEGTGTNGNQLPYGRS